MIKGVYGINIAVKDLDGAIEKYEGLLGMKVTKILSEGDFAFPGLKGAAFDVGGVVIQVIASVTEDTSVAKFVKTKGEGLFLVSLRSDDVLADTHRMQEAGATFVLKEAVHGKFGAVNFIHPKSACGVQIEVYDPDYK